MRSSFIRAGVLIALSAATLPAQQIGNLDAPVAKQKSFVVYDTEQQEIVAGKRSVLELRFRVVDGFHVNSHTPKSELLIPTQLVLQQASGVKAEAVEYPAGTSYSFSFNPTEKLDVYSGTFTVRLPVVVESGAHTINGTLRYQACDHAACYPPRNLPLQVIITAK